MVKTCPICGKKLAGKKALAQHRESVHARPVVNAPVRVMRRARPARKINNGTVSSGNDILKSISVNSGTRAGTLLYTMMLSPVHVTGTRLGAESMLWSRWRPMKLRLIATCSGSSTTFGSLMIGWSADCTLRISHTAEHALTQMGAMAVRQTTRMNGTVELNLPINMTRKWLECNGDPTDEEEYSYGSFHVLVSSDVGGFTGRLSCQLELAWTVSWYGQEVTNIDLPNESFITPDAGWSNLFTTSDGSFDSTRLTFKMHSGGDMVPFTSAQQGVVYTSYGTNTTVWYVDETGKSKQCYYFARVKQYAVPGLLLFGSYGDAKAYNDSGDVTKALKYTAASQYTTPLIPRFVVKSETTVAYESDRIAREEQQSTASGASSQYVEFLEARIACLEAQMKNLCFRPESSSVDDF